MELQAEPGMAAAETAAAGQEAQRVGDHERALRLYLDAASASEIPPADLCVKIARCHEHLGRNEEAFEWLRRVVDASDAFLPWSSASAALKRLRQEARPPARRTCRVALTGSYTLAQLGAMLPLAALRLGIDIDLHEGLYGQYRQDLIDPRSALYGFGPDHVVLAVHEGVLELPAYSDDPGAAVEAETARWRGLWDAVAAHSGAAVVQHGFALRPEAPFGHLSAGLPGSRYAMAQEVNRRLAAEAPAGVSVVDCDRLAAYHGRQRWFDDRYWVRSKQAVALEALPLLARHTAAVIAARLGLGRKCLVLDLDNTLWGGVIGEDGLDGIRLGGDGSGEAFAAFQEDVLALKERGIVLAVASKNNESDAREVFERHPEMRIGLDDISMFAVGWEDKPASLRRIAEALNIGLDALALADDNPAERQMVRRLVPEVDVIPLPPEPAEYRRALADYLGFESVSITAEDRQRSGQYRARAAAAELRSSATDIESFYRDLRMRARVAPFDELNLQRIVQLIGKTNQFNLTTRRHDVAAVQSFMASERHVTRYLRLRDRLADHGLVALLIAEQDGDALEIDTFLMSCRVIGRTVEAQLLASLAAEADRRGVAKLRGTYVPTAKNAVVRDLYAGFGFTPLGEDGDGTTRWEYDLAAHGPITNEFIEETEDLDRA